MPVMAESAEAFVRDLERRWTPGTQVQIGTTSWVREDVLFHIQHEMKLFTLERLRCLSSDLPLGAVVRSIEYRFGFFASGSGRWVGARTSPMVPEHDMKAIMDAARERWGLG